MRERKGVGSERMGLGDGGSGGRRSRGEVFSAMKNIALLAKWVLLVFMLIIHTLPVLCRVNLLVSMEMAQLA